jgi:hypothetical protein
VSVLIEGVEIGVLAQRDPVSIRLRVSRRVEAKTPPLESG